MFPWKLSESFASPYANLPIRMAPLVGIVRPFHRPKVQFTGTLRPPLFTNFLLCPFPPVAHAIIPRSLTRDESGVIRLVIELDPDIPRRSSFVRRAPGLLIRSSCGVPLLILFQASAPPSAFFTFPSGGHLLLHQVFVVGELCPFLHV